jgi:hypothetical protein
MESTPIRSSGRHTTRTPLGQAYDQEKSKKEAAAAKKNSQSKFKGKTQSNTQCSQVASNNIQKRRRIENQQEFVQYWTAPDYDPSTVSPIRTYPHARTSLSSPSSPSSPTIASNPSSPVAAVATDSGVVAR